MTGEVIKSFLVGLGFGVDETGLSKFNSAITQATLKANLLSNVIVNAASNITGGLADISKDFEELGYQYRLISPLMNKAIILRRELFRAYSSAGIDIQKAVLASLRLNMSLTKTRYALEGLYKSVALKFFGLLTKESDLFRRQIYANMPKIQEILMSLVGSVFKALGVITQLGKTLWFVFEKVWDFLKELDKSTDGWAVKLGLVLIAWRALSSGFASTPLGRLILALGTILILLDDYIYWKEHHEKTLFDWSSFEPVIKSVGEALDKVRDSIIAIRDAFKDLKTLLSDPFGLKAWQDLEKFLGSFNNLGEKLDITIHKIINSIHDLANWVEFTLNKIPFFKNIIGVINSFGSPTSTLPQGTYGPANFLDNFGTAPIQYGPPLGSGVDQSQNSAFNNVNVQQQTTILTQPGADAQTIGKIAGNSVSTKSIFDAIRNMQGSILPGGQLT